MSSRLSVSSAQERDVEVAFAQVLQAEQAARAAVDDARAQAARIAESCRAEARARAERTRARIATVRAAFEATLQSELRRLSDEAETLSGVTPLVTADHERVERAVHQLAARLTGGEP